MNRDELYSFYRNNMLYMGEKIRFTVGGSVRNGILKDLEKDKAIGMYAEEMEEVLPEAVRHDPEGRMAINYNAVVTVLVEAFKEQQARIDQLESILRGNGLLENKK